MADLRRTDQVSRDRVPSDPARVTPNILRFAAISHRGDRAYNHCRSRCNILTTAIRMISARSRVAAVCSRTNSFAAKDCSRLDTSLSR
jgi:hypothetical protein